MTRLIGVEYGGDMFHIVGRELADVLAEIDAGSLLGGCWLSVRADGGRSAATLLVSRGTPIAFERLPDF